MTLFCLFVQVINGRPNQDYLKYLLQHQQMQQALTSFWDKHMQQMAAERLSSSLFSMPRQHPSGALSMFSNRNIVENSRNF